MSGEEAALGIFVFGGAFWVLRPLVGALAKRIGGEVPHTKLPQLDEAVLSELQQLRQDVSDLAERVDFAERLLAKQKDPGRLGAPGGG
jgi:hypothetical protein